MESSEGFLEDSEDKLSEEQCFEEFRKEFEEFFGEFLNFWQYYIKILKNSLETPPQVYLLKKILEEHVEGSLEESADKFMNLGL